MSRMAASSSTRVPASAGVMPAGGAYCTATGPTRGSRPRVYHSQNMNRKTGTGKNNGQLLSKNRLTRSLVAGSLTKPLSQPTTTVKPSWKESGRSMETFTLLSDVATSAFWAREPYEHVNAGGAIPDTPGGSRICALAFSMGTSHSSPVTFQ